MSFVLTGATGFVGKALTELLLSQSKELRFIVRSNRKLVQKNALSLEFEALYRPCSKLEKNKSMSEALEGNEAIIHVAGIANSPGRGIRQDEMLFREVNTLATLNLAQHAVNAKVKRFVFISSIKVNREVALSKPFSSDTESISADLYASSKYEAEKGLLELAKHSDMEVVIIRPPLVYGPGVKANFASLVDIVKKGLPLPLGAVNNKRSMIAIDNLVDFIALCADRERSPQAANQVFVISDDEDVSTTKLLQKIAKAYGKKQWLIPVPVSWMKFVAKVLGKGEQADRLFGNLQVDCSKAKELLGWKPVITMDGQLKKMADAEK
jgi:nucleoside-diphosphate-sugar epimerase